MTLIDALTQVPEFRNRSGKRHGMACVLTCLLLGTMSGCISWRDHGAFVRRHHAALLEHLRPEKDRLPSYSTLRRVLLGLDFDAFSAAFFSWAKQHVEIAEGEWLAGDGKSLRGTVTDVTDAQQNFISLVTFFTHKHGLVLHSDSYQNAKESEVHVIESMLSQIDLEGKGVTLDALHCKKRLVS